MENLENQEIETVVVNKAELDELVEGAKQLMEKVQEQEMEIEELKKPSEVKSLDSELMDLRDILLPKKEENDINDDMDNIFNSEVE